jgi:hypothetical protein
VPVELLADKFGANDGAEVLRTRPGAVVVHVAGERVTLLKYDDEEGARVRTNTLSGGYCRARMRRDSI